MGKSGFVVAISQKEADEIARDLPDLVYADLEDAEIHLRDCKAPPTDPYWSNQFKIYTVER